MKLNRLSFVLAFSLLCAAPVAMAGGPGIGDPAPDFTLNDVNGDPHSLSDFDNRVVLINFWQST